MLVFTLVAILLHGMKTSDTIIVRQVSVISGGLTGLWVAVVTLEKGRKPLL